MCVCVCVCVCVCDGVLHLPACHYLLLPATACQVLAGVCDGVLPLAECSEVLGDALRLLASKDIKVRVWKREWAKGGGRGRSLGRGGGGGKAWKLCWSLYMPHLLCYCLLTGVCQPLGRP